MFQKLKDFNEKHNDLPVKVAAGVLGAVLVGGAMFAYYRFSHNYADIVGSFPVEELLETTTEVASSVASV